VRQGLQRVELRCLGAEQAVHLLRGDRRDVGRRFVPEIVELEGVQMGLVAPIARPCLQHGLLAHGVLEQLERAGAVRTNAELAALLGVEHRERIVEKVLRYGELRGLGIEPDGMVVQLLDGVGVP
jgi:hypothetical protein